MPSGIVTPEIVAGKHTDWKVNDSDYLVYWAYELEETGHLLQLVDPSLGSNCTTQEALRDLQVALLRVNDKAGLRPGMNEVVEALTDQTSFDQLLGNQRYADDDPLTSKTRTSGVTP
ncbi:putative LRR receptor-like serine/threonine-protein kinase At1g07650 [Bidens hawaiensis]|uniref:putative LRR receptor-like serine/threonine-protein kinase At1g07650 n=1 Tax=Bidens hawaiensis TaxID=980011 RepID=UPI004048F5BE